MTLSPKITQLLKTASAKALATTGPHGINVVPVSTIHVTDDSIWLFNFFMDKTIANITTNDDVALTAWTALTGLQIKATTIYYTDGEMFDRAIAWLREHHPNHAASGVLVLKPTALFDISPSKTFSNTDLQLS